MKRGDIIILDVPFPDRTGTKVRPDLIVQADLYAVSIVTVRSQNLVFGNVIYDDLASEAEIVYCHGGSKSDTIGNRLDSVSSK